MARYTTIICLFCLAFFNGSLLALNINVTQVVSKDNAVNAIPKLEFLKNFEGSNQVKLLNNRFRVDYEVDELLMLFFRKHGSKPIVLVKPDGSKIYARDADKVTLSWHADVNYDLIKIKNPTPGPWQAVGRIEKNSRIIVLSDVELVVDKLPELVFQYEELKGEARIENAKQIIKEGGFRNVVRLRSALYSTNDADQENFGADLHRLGEFFDDGKQLDEKPNDGVFTLSYYIDVVTGAWIPKYTLEAELFGRELSQEPITVLPNPISYDIKIAEPTERYHYINIEVDPTYLEDEKTMFQGTIQFPNGEVQTFSLSQQHKRELEIFQGEFGTYVITTEVFGTDRSGRDFKLKLPPHEFITVEPQLEVDILPEMSEEQMLAEAALTSLDPVKKEPEISVALVVLINLIILIIGFVLIWVFVLQKTIPNPIAVIKNLKSAKKGKNDDKGDDEKNAKKPAQTSDSDDILDLSLPED